MCGIIGFNFKNDNEKIFSVTSHRGPDNTSKIEVNGFTFGHNRLSIVDHNEESNQPMISECGRYTIIFNGEVYNHGEIRTKLQNKYKFKTHSDTEAILYAYIEYGEKCLDDFRGMFAFAIYDEKENKLFCARDRLGIKPFVYYEKDSKLIFGSEIKVVLEALGTKPRVNQEAILQYLHYLYVPYPNTIFEDIKKLPPAHTLTYKDGKCEIRKYWDVEEHKGLSLDMNENEIITSLDNLLDESVKMRMIADVELGSF